MDGAAAWILMASTMTVMVSSHHVCFTGLEYNSQSGTPHRWFLPYKDPCQCTAIRLGGMNVPASSYRQGSPYYLAGLFLSEDFDEIQAFFECSRPTTVPTEPECLNPEALGMEDKTIPDGRISASSQFECYPPWMGRLGGDEPWKALESDAVPWIEVDLVDMVVVAGVITQGYSSWWVRKYRVAYKPTTSSPNYIHITGVNGAPKVFIANNDDETPVTNLFDACFVATAVRIEPTEWRDGVALQLELLGCRRG